MEKELIKIINDLQERINNLQAELEQHYILKGRYLEAIDNKEIELGYEQGLNDMAIKGKKKMIGTYEELIKQIGNLITNRS